MAFLKKDAQYTIDVSTAFDLGIVQEGSELCTQSPTPFLQWRVTTGRWLPSLGLHLL